MLGQPTAPPNGGREMGGMIMVQRRFRRPVGFRAVRPARAIGVLLVALGVGLAVCCASGAGEQPAGPGKPGREDACPVCGMLVSPYPAWVAQVVFEDGSSAFFDGCKDMFKYLLARDRYLPEKRQATIAAVYVTDYYHLTPIEGRSAHFVMGSDVLGPMGHELVPLATLAAAKEFSGDHGGARIVRFEEVTPELLSGLN